MADLGLPEVSPLLQLRYQRDFNQIIFNNKTDALFAHLETKSENDGGGAGYVIQFQTEGTVTASADYALAGGAYGAHQCTVTAAYVNWKATVTKKAIDGAKEKGGRALFDVCKTAIDMAMHKTMRKIGRHLSSRYAEIGRIAAIAGATVTIGNGLPATTDANPVMTNRLSASMVLVAAAAQLTGTLRGASPGDSATLASWDPGTGVLTVNAVPGTWQVGDYLYEKGDRYYDGATGQRMLAGIKAWLDHVADGTIYGKNRAGIPELQPMRKNLSGIDLRVGLLRLQQELFTNGSEADLAFCSPVQWTAIQESVDASQIVNVNVTKEGSAGTFTIGFKGIELAGSGNKPLVVLQSVYIESGLVYMGPFNDKEYGFKLYYTDKLIRIDMQNGTAFTRLENGVTDSATGDSVPAYRAEGDARLAVVCKAPGKYIVGYNFTGA